jgi:uncharacterized phage protein (TIGR01671 family)
LFRGKTEPDGHWVYGSLISRRVFSGWLHWITYQELVDKKNELWLDCEARVRVKSETVGQYTGLKDKNGVKIFEGDIVVAFRGEDCEEVNAVYYNANHCKWFLGSPYNNKLPMGLGEFCWLDLEVIGNIHDNPKLLGVG